MKRYQKYTVILAHSFLSLFIYFIARRNEQSEANERKEPQMNGWLANRNDLALEQIRVTSGSTLICFYYGMT